MTVDEALAEVGDDQVRAQELLNEEQAKGAAARSTLVTGLQAVIARAQAAQVAEADAEKSVTVRLTGSSHRGQPGDTRQVTAERADWLEQNHLAQRV